MLFQLAPDVPYKHELMACPAFHAPQEVYRAQHMRDRSTRTDSKPVQRAVPSDAASSENQRLHRCATAYDSVAAVAMHCRAAGLARVDGRPRATLSSFVVAR